jgi:hypothetical protein
MTFNNKQTVNTSNTHFLGIIVDNTISWKNHVDNLMEKLSEACIAIRTINPFVSQTSTFSNLLLPIPVLLLCNLSYLFVILIYLVLVSFVYKPNSLTASSNF